MFPWNNYKKNTSWATWEIILGRRCSLGGNHGCGYYPGKLHTGREAHRTDQEWMITEVSSQKNRRKESQHNQILQRLIYKDGDHQVLLFLYAKATPPLKDKVYSLASWIWAGPVLWVALWLLCPIKCSRNNTLMLWNPSLKKTGSSASFLLEWS